MSECFDPHERIWQATFPVQSRGGGRGGGVIGDESLNDVLFSCTFLGMFFRVKSQGEAREGSVAWKI